MEKRAGIVEAVSEKITKKGNKRYGVRILGEWFNTFKEHQAKKGDTVELTFQPNPPYGNKIVEMNVITKNPDKVSAPSKSASPPARGIGPLEAVAPDKPGMNPPSSSEQAIICPHCKKELKITIEDEDYDPDEVSTRFD